MGAKDAKSVRMSHGTDYCIAAAGNIQSPKSNRKLYNRTQENARMGGTNNLIRAAFGLDGKKLCKVVTREIDEHVWVRGEMVRTNTKPVVTNTVVVTPDIIPTSTILMRAERKDMTPIAYCMFIGYTPTDEQIDELIEVS